MPHAHTPSRPFSFRYKCDAPETGGGWQRLGSAPLTTDRIDDGEGWRVKPQLVSVDEHSANLTWTPPPAHKPEELDYMMIVTRNPAGAGKDVTIVPGPDNRFRIDDIEGEPLKPGDRLLVTML